MNDRRTTTTGSKYDRDRLRRPEVIQEYVKFSTCVEESEKNNMNRKILQQIITETADEVIGKREKAE
jgi:hypothetical protein